MKKIVLLLLFMQTLVSAQTTDPDSVMQWYERDHVKYPERAHQHILNGIRQAQKRKDKYHVATYLVKLIEEKNFQRDYAGSYVAFRKAEKYCKDHKVYEQLACAYSQYAEACFNKEDHDQAMKYFRMADAVFESQQDGIGVAISKNNIANIYQVKGRYDLAIKNLLDAAKYVDTTKYRYIKVSLFNNVSELYRTIGDNTKAEGMVRKALHLALSAKQDNPEGLLTAYALLSSLLVESGKNTEAEKYISAGLQLADAEHLGGFRFELLKSKITLAMAKNQITEAKKLIGEALLLAKEYKKNTYEKYPVNTNLARIYLLEGQSAKAIRLLNELLGEATQIDRKDDIAEIYNELSQAYETTGDYKKAIHHHKLYVAYKDSILGREKQQFFKDAQVKYETAIKEKQLAESKVALLKKSTESKKKTTTIIMLAALAFFLMVLSYLIYRQQKLKVGQQQKEYQLREAISLIETQNKLQEQRLSISRDLHDNIGAQLTFIISSVDNVKFGFNLQNTKLNEKLDSISDFTKSTIVELRDTIWAMNHSEISFEELRSRIFNFLEKAKSAQSNIDYRFHLDESLKHLSFSSLQGINLYRTIQEAVNNAMKYAHASKIVIEAKSERNTTIIEIRDNGIGFDMAESNAGNGLGNMKKRMKEIGAKFDIKSELNEGTTVTVSLQNNIDHA
ncbi:tetratricopeptide repeat protein [Flavobacterium sp.]|uniref:tetratricopeptide repeat protein n=1 Tax=Flavobacterium sp. TaxID=239 RepID=UPI00262C4504|nr:tetratricopeptide repeat protein [Flavobacterium sp.]